MGGFTKTTGISPWYDGQYDDGSGTLQPLTNNWYTTIWWYLDVNGELSKVYGRSNSKTDAEAREEPQPTHPAFLDPSGRLISRWIIQEGVNDAPTAMDSVFTPFSSATIQQHSQLPDLATSGHPADIIANTPAGGVTETDAQGAIDGLETRKLDKADASAALQVVIGNGTDVIATGDYGKMEVPFACTLSRWTILAEETGDLDVRVDKDVYANYPPTAADSICAAACPSVSNANKGQSSTLTGWTTTISEDDILSFVVTGTPATITQATVSLKCTR